MERCGKYGGFKHFFQAFFIFHFIYGIILPIDELIFFKMVTAPPTRWDVILPIKQTTKMKFPYDNTHGGMTQYPCENSNDWHFITTIIGIITI